MWAESELGDFGSCKLFILESLKTKQKKNDASSITYEILSSSSNKLQQNVTFTKKKDDV